jgi:RHS repeat-associated protein
VKSCTSAGKRVFRERQVEKHGGVCQVNILNVPLACSSHQPVDRRGTLFCKNLVQTVAVLSLMLLWAGAQAQGTFDQSRVSSFTYYGASDDLKNGLLKSETIEPDNPQLCVTTTYTYDGYGNKTGATTANCAGATGRAPFTPRGGSSAYPQQVVTLADGNATIPAGTFPSTATNALSQSETKTYDPRFGAVLTLLGPNALPTSWQIDDLGRKVKELRADGTSTVNYYCFIGGRPNSVSDLSSNTAACPTPVAAEIPADAIAFVHSEPRDTGGSKMGPFSRIYTDAAGRKIRSVTEAFDGASQPGGTNRLIVQDTDYSQYGVAVVSTQPYFLDSGSSAATGAVGYGMTLTNYDVLARPIAVYSTDIVATDPAGVGNNGGNQGGSQTGGVAFGGRGSRQAAKTSIAYNGLTTTTTNDKLQTRVEEKNSDGKLVRVTDALAAQVAYQHDAFGNLLITKDALQNQLVVAYDVRGRKTSMTDPDTGLWQYDYNALGELVWQQSANQRTASTATTMAYDVLGRMVTRTEPEYTSTWSYDQYANASACNKGIGKLCESNTSAGVNRKLVYDNLGRPINSRTTITSGPSFASAVSYDASGRLDTQTYPTGLQVRYNYTAKSFLSSLTLVTSATVNPKPKTVGGTPAAGTTLAAGATLWQSQAFNARGQAEQQSYGNGVITKAVFDAATGRMTGLTAGVGSATNVLKHGYVWDSISHLVQRNDENGDDPNGDLSAGALTDAYSYDALGRMKSYSVAATSSAGLLTRNVLLQFNAAGMLLYKSDVGVYSYGAQNTAGVRPHALQSVTGGGVTTSYAYDGNGNLITADSGKYRSIAYTSFNLPDSNAGAQGPAGNPKYTWAYDENHQRIKETQVTSAGTRTTWNLHPDNAGGLGFESESSTASPTPSNRHYLSVGGVSVGVLVSQAALPTLTGTQTAPTALTTMTLVKVEYWHKDHLGSLISTTDHAATVTARYSYDPFGKRRTTHGNYDAFGNVVYDWTTNTDHGTDRGYTGHEHLDDLGVIHMNGRIFDPTLGRFLQGDPLIQDSGNLQSFDRYGYCYNNPMGCTDPSGLCWANCFWQPIQAGNIVAKNVFRLIRSMPGQEAVDRYIMNNKWAYLAGQAAAAYWGGYFGAALFASYYTYQSTGSISAARRAAAISAGTSMAFTYVGTSYSGYTDSAGKITDYSQFGQAVAAHAAVGCASSVAGGGQCLAGALSAGFSKAAVGFTGPLGQSNPEVGIAVSAVIGGTASVLGGGKFENGAATAAFGYIFNALGNRIIKDLYALKDSRFAGELKGHHRFDEVLARDFDSVMTPEAINAAATDRIGQGYVGTGLAGDPHVGFNAEHRAASAALRMQMENWVVEGRISQEAPMSIKQYWEFMAEAQRIPVVSNFWNAINEFAQLWMSRGVVPKMRGVSRFRGMSE